MFVLFYTTSVAESVAKCAFAMVFNKEFEFDLGDQNQENSKIKEFATYFSRLGRCIGDCIEGV